jgi:predicted RNase H-like HicB family nuclease
MKKLSVRIFKSEKWYVAECLELPGCVSQGRTRASALRNIKEAIALYLESVEAHKETMPKTEIVQVAVLA